MPLDRDGTTTPTAKVPGGQGRGREGAEGVDVDYAPRRGAGPGARVDPEPRRTAARPDRTSRPSSLGDIVSGPGRAESFTTPCRPGSCRHDGRTTRAGPPARRRVRPHMRPSWPSRRLRGRGRQIPRSSTSPGRVRSRQARRTYRLHGPTLLIEYDNSQNDANHVHSVWHDPLRDFGLDALKAHDDHGHRHA